MTSMAVTARICASAPEAAFLVASFIVVSLDMGIQDFGIQDVGMSHRCPRRLDGSLIFYAEHPTTSIRFNESPLSEYRRFQDRILMRREFEGIVAT
jgi:hypothetical protein